MLSCYIDITSVKVLDDYCLRLSFEDGKIGQVDIAKLIPFKGVFSPLQDKGFFAKVKVNKDVGTICWENGADLSPGYLYENCY